MVKYFDTDKNGKASEKEFVAGVMQKDGVSKSVAEDRFKQYDIDGDGQITRNEFLKTELGKFWDNDVLKKDKDKDGLITKFEFDQAIGSKAPQDKKDAVFKEMDTDNNGTITRAEFTTVGGMNLKTGYLASAMLLAVSLMQ